MLRVVLAVVVAVAAGAARADERLHTGPEPQWVKLRPPVDYVPPPADGLPASLIRSDTQIDIRPDGEAVYLEQFTQVRTTLGLQAAGLISISWDPSRESIHVHRVRIRRQGLTTDVLAKQKFEILRREESLAELVDGRLTATLRPEDLRLGDMIELAYTRFRKDPVLAGRADLAFDLGDTQGVGQFNLRARWPDAQRVAWRGGSALPAPRIKRAGGSTELSFTLESPQPLKGPAGAPARYWPTRELEFSSFSSWSEVGALLAPSYDAASRLSPQSPLKAEVAKIQAASEDPKVQAAAALKLVQDQVRYLGLVLPDGGYTPVHADSTWSRRFGECKGKTVLLIALLRELGIKAEPALVSTFGGEGIGRSLPRMSAFNHVIARVEIGNQVYWLDGTRTGDGGLDAVDVPPFHWALPIRSENAALISLQRSPRSLPDTQTLIEVDASNGVESLAPAKGQMIMRGDRGLWPAIMRENLPAADREKMLKAMWSAYPWIEVKTAEATRDPATGESRLSMTGTARLKWFPGPGGVGLLYVPQAYLGWRQDFKREAGPGEDAPYQVPHPNYTAQKFTLRLPYEGKGFSVPAADVDRTIAGRAFFRRSKIDGAVLTIESSTRTVAAEFPASEAQAAGEALRAMSAVRVVVQAPADYKATEGDIAGWLADKPTTSAEYLNRGGRLARAGRNGEAMKDFEKAIALDPTSSAAHAGRGMLRTQTRDFALARKDLEEAARLDPKNPAAPGGLGQLAVEEGQYEDAVRLFSEAAGLSPGNVIAIGARANAYKKLGLYDKALSDLTTVLAIDPKLYGALLDRAEAHLAKGDHALALADVDQAAESAPEDPYVETFRGALLTRMDRRAEAARAFEAALKIKPTAQTYLTRAANREKSDLAGRLADLDAADKLDPDKSESLPIRARAYLDAGQPRQALQVLAGALKAEPDRSQLLELRAIAYVRMGQASPAIRDFNQLRAKAADNAAALNSLCWTLGTIGFALEAARTDCEAALKIAPKQANALDSYGLVLLRLGELDAALAAYDEAVRIRPKQADSLFGRGLTKIRLGRRADGEADLAAARAARPTIEQEFAGYGLLGERTGQVR